MSSDITKKYETASLSKRRFYTARTISQQTEPYKTTEEKKDFQMAGLEFQTQVTPEFQNEAKECAIAEYATSGIIHENAYYENQPKRRRRLGGIELMYYQSMSRGTDMICLMTKVESTFQVTETAARKALTSLMLRHPLLRTTIKQNNPADQYDLSFIEHSYLECDFVVSPRKDWQTYLLEEVEKPFQEQTMPLWRCRMLNSTKIPVTQPCLSCMSERDHNHACLNQSNLGSKFRYEATMLFILHHSVMDGGYSLWIFQEFVNFLDAYVQGTDIDRVKVMPLLPPVEKCLSPPAQRFAEFLPLPLCDDSYLQFCDDKVECDRTFIRAYNSMFCNEIASLSSNKPKNNCLIFNLSRENTKTLASSCKTYRANPNGVVVAASLLAFLDLVYPRRSTIPEFKIPFDFMMDLRRTCQFDECDETTPHYPGVASFHIPMKAHIKVQGIDISMKRFWQMSTSFGNSIQNDINTPETFEWIQKEADNYLKLPNHNKESGKSDYVVCVSNMGKLDNVLTSDVTERVRLVGLHGTSSVLVDQMPIFFVTTFSLNGQFHGSVSFCDGYTSLSTASKYVGHLQKYLTNYSKI